MCRCGNPVLRVWDQYSSHGGPELMLLSLLLPVQEGETQDRECNHQATRPMLLCCSGYRGLAMHGYQEGWQKPWAAYHPARAPGNAVSCVPAVTATSQQVARPHAD